tara:strand:+ start:400 stop:612 length:213 start_codon:yes stop_codon:yes gene_type:complete
MIFGMDMEFKPEHADSIVEHCQTNGLSEMETWLHCLSVAAGMNPSKEMTLMAVELIYSTTKIVADQETIQ